MSEQTPSNPLVETEGVNAGSAGQSAEAAPVRHGRHRAPGPDRKDFTPGTDPARAGGRPSDAPVDPARGDLDPADGQDDSQFAGAPEARSGEAAHDSGQDAGSID
jgi:hypothetical protein